MLMNTLQPITLKLSGKVIKNRLYRSPLSEYGSVYDEHNIENTGKPKARYTELYQGIYVLSWNISIVKNEFHVRVPS